MRPEREGLLNGDEPDYDSVESDYEPVLGAVPSANRRRSVPLSTRGRAINILQVSRRSRVTTPRIPGADLQAGG
jgi:hypothetical protein